MTRTIIWVGLAALSWLLLGGIVATLLAAPPDGAPVDGPTADWYHGLRAPDTGNGCCDLSDCRHLPTRVGKNGYEVQVPELGDEWLELPTKHWIAIPPEKILLRKENPTGAPITCWSPYRGVMCFVEGTGT